MESNRTLVLKRRPKLILDKRFPVFRELNVGDTGQMIIDGKITAERQEFHEDGVDLIVKTLEVTKAEILTNKNARNFV